MRTFILAILAVFTIGLTFAEAGGPVRRVLRNVQARRIQRIQARQVIVVRRPAAIVVGRQQVIVRRAYNYRATVVVGGYAQQIAVAPITQAYAAPPVAQEVAVPDCPVQVAPVQYTQRVILRQQVGGCYQSLRLGFRY